MTDYPISGLTAKAAPGSGDLIPIVDVSDTTTAPAGPNGSDKKVTFGNFTAGLAKVVPPSGDTTGATDLANIQAAVTAGYCQLTAGSYYINAPISVPTGGTVIRGMARSGINQNTQTQIYAVATMPAIIASANWLGSGSTYAGNSVTIENVQLYGKYNSTQYATHGMALQTWDSLIRDVYISFVTGDGIRFDAANNAQTTFITSTGVNNRIYDCTFLSVGQGFACYDNPTYASATTTWTDGYLVDCTVAGATGIHGVTIDHSAGWVISGNHLYGLAQNGINAAGSGNTRITDNYFEYVGTGAASGTYSAIFAHMYSGAALIVTGNQFWQYNAPGNAGSTIIGISVDSGVADAPLVCSNNSLYLAISSGFAAAYGIYLSTDGSGDKLNAVGVGNNVFSGSSWTQTVQLVPNGGTIQLGPNAWVPVTLASPLSGTVYYRLYPDNTVRFKGSVSLTASAAAYTTILTLPSNMKPVSNQYFFQPNNLSGWTSGASIAAYTTGAVELGASGSSGNSVVLDGMCVVLD